MGVHHVLGNKYYGIYSLKGKPSNLEELHVIGLSSQYVKLCLALGIKGQTTEIEDLEGQLRYGHVMLMMDQVNLLTYSIFPPHFTTLLLKMLKWT